MDFALPDIVRQLLLFAPVFIISLTFHEYAHGWMANKLGDATARHMGRLTMDPMAHISWVGTVIFPALSLVTGAPLFGWANPVPVDARNFRKPLQHMAIVAAAGPASNILLAILSTAILSFLVNHGANFSIANNLTGVNSAAIEMLVMAVQLNLFLAFFNLIPLPPLDGSRIVQGFVKASTAQKIDEFASTAQCILLILVFTGALRIVAIPVYGFMSLLFRTFGIPS